MSKSNATSNGVKLFSVNWPQRRVEPQNLSAVFFRFPGLEVTEHLPSEGFVDFKKVEILKREFIPNKELRDCFCSGHQQTGAPHEINSCRLEVHQFSKRSYS